MREVTTGNNASRDYLPLHRERTLATGAGVGGLPLQSPNRRPGPAGGATLHHEDCCGAVSAGAPATRRHEPGMSEKKSSCAQKGSTSCPNGEQFGFLVPSSRARTSLSYYTVFGMF